MNNKNLVGLGLTGALLVGSLSCTAFALNNENERTSEEIQVDINNVKDMMDVAHEMAKNARELGVEEDDYIIWFAKQQWNEYNDKLSELNDEYNKTLEKEKEKEQEGKGEYLGEFKLTRYCSGSCCNGGYNGTALGTPIVAGRTIAVDPKVIPLGSQVYIEGYGTFIAEDTGGAIKGNKIDIAVGSHSEAMQGGVSYANVYVK